MSLLFVTVFAFPFTVLVQDAKCEFMRVHFETHAVATQAVHIEITAEWER